MARPYMNEIAVFMVTPYGIDTTEEVRKLMARDLFGDQYGQGVNFVFIDGDYCLDPDFLLEYIEPEHSILVLTWLDQNDGLHFAYTDGEEDVKEFVDFLQSRMGDYRGSSYFVWDLAMEFYDKADKIPI